MRRRIKKRMSRLYESRRHAFDFTIEIHWKSCTEKRKLSFMVAHTYRRVDSGQFAPLLQRQFPKRDF